MLVKQDNVTSFSQPSFEQATWLCVLSCPGHFRIRNLFCLLNLDDFLLFLFSPPDAATRVTATAAATRSSSSSGGLEGLSDGT